MPAQSWSHPLRPWKVALGVLALAATLLARPFPLGPAGPALTWLTRLVAVALLLPVLPEAWHRARARGWRLLLAVAACFVAVFLLEYLAWPVLRSLVTGPVPDGNTASVLQAYGSRWLLALMVLGLGPVVEESLYRYVVFGALARVNVWGGALVSSFLFGLQHVLVPLGRGDLSAWWNVPQYMIFGLGACWLYRRERTIIAPWLFHVLNNALVLLVA